MCGVYGVEGKKIPAGDVESARGLSVWLRGLQLLVERIVDAEPSVLRPRHAIALMISRSAMVACYLFSVIMLSVASELHWFTGSLVYLTRLLE